MCLIIKREPGFEIPFEKFKAAVEVNPDGYGLAYPDADGKLVTLRNPVKPDVDKLYRLINEELIDQNLLIHLRYTTVGETTLRNAHPFPILERNTDGIDLRMAHNGTLFDYKQKASGDESDTRVFVREFVRPLFKRMAKVLDPAELVDDPLLKDILEDKMSAASVLTFIDGHGNSMIINETGNGGKKEDGWYYSNKYSFNSDHRKPKASGYNRTQSVGQTTMGSTQRTSPVSSTSNSYMSRGFNTQLFTEKMDMKKRELTTLSDDTIRLAVSSGEAPNLIKELILELDKAWTTNRSQATQLKKLKEKVSE